VKYGVFPKSVVSATYCHQFQGIDERELRRLGSQGRSEKPKHLELIKVEKYALLPASHCQTLEGSDISLGSYAVGLDTHPAEASIHSDVLYS
jgi:hypothetical protein